MNFEIQFSYPMYIYRCRSIISWGTTGGPSCGRWAGSVGSVGSAERASHEWSAGPDHDHMRGDRAEGAVTKMSRRVGMGTRTPPWTVPSTSWV